MIALRTLSLGQFAAQIKVQERVKQLIPNFDNFHLFSLDKNVIKKKKIDKSAFICGLYLTQSEN